MGYAKPDCDKNPGTNFEASVLCDAATGKAIRNATDGEAARGREANAFNLFEIDRRGLEVDRISWRPEDEIFAAPHVDGVRRFERRGTSIVTKNQQGAASGLRSPRADATVENEGVIRAGRRSAV